jgi:hypothetical protein
LSRKITALAFSACFFKSKNDNVKRSSEEQLADIAHEFVRQNKSKRRWRILLSLLFFGYIFSVSYVNNKVTKRIKLCFASFSCWLFKLQCVGRINRILTPIIYLFGQLFF